MLCVYRFPQTILGDCCHPKLVARVRVQDCPTLGTVDGAPELVARSLGTSCLNSLLYPQKPQRVGCKIITSYIARQAAHLRRFVAKIAITQVLVPSSSSSPCVMRFFVARIATTQVKYCKRSTSSSPCVMHRVSAWKGLEAWRSALIDERRVWGTKNCPVVEKDQAFPVGDGSGLDFSGAITSTTATDGKIEPQSLATRAAVGSNVRVSGHVSEIGDLASWGHLVLVTKDPLLKAWLTHRAYCLWTNGQLDLGVASAPDTPGRPPKPELVPPRQVPGPKECSLPSNAHLLHNLAHIELNAIDLAWDTVVRFSYASEELGRQFFADFVHVADDESRHFRWCSQRLAELGYSYGDIPAHNLLWQDCMKTSKDVKSRLAVIPMTQEARGLDAGPRLVKRLLGLDDHRSAAIVRRIGQEEVAHVGVGVFHFLRICEKLGVDPGDEFQEIMEECDVQLHGPFNHKAREVAGLRREWYDKSDPTESLEAQQKSHRLGWKGRDRDGKEKNTEVASDLSKQSQESSKPVDEKTRAALQSCSTEGNGGLVPDKGNSRNESSLLAEVYQRLALLVAMEKENAGT